MNWKWLESTRVLQEDAFKINFADLASDGEALANYVLWNHSALIIELSEFMDEVQWKPWVKTRGGLNRELAVKELIDAAHFLGNLAVALGVTDEEWERRYREKQAINSKRQADGYDGVSTKCTNCSRALDDVVPYEVDGSRYCRGCGYLLSEAT